MRALTQALAGTVLLALGVAAAGADAPATARDIESAIEAYVGQQPDATLVGGPGSAGYDGGFWLRGGEFSLKLGLTLQARYEAVDLDDSHPFEGPDGIGGDLSGFSLPRATLKFSGTAPCNICYYMELEFGHVGEFAEGLAEFMGDESESNLGPSGGQSFNFDNTREAWIEWCYCPSFNVRVGQIRLPATRQLMVAAEHQQFVDISLASSMNGWLLPGYTDRNRDHGVMVHGSLGCRGEWSYALAVSNGDGGDSIRNVLDPRSSDNLAYSARVNWAFAQPIGYQEGALGFDTCSWYGEVGIWAFYYADRADKPHVEYADITIYGVDLALGYGGFSLTGAFTLGDLDNIEGSPLEVSYASYLAQLGFHLPGTAWELAGRWSAWTQDANFAGRPATTTEYAVALNYYLNGHGNKLQLDVSWLSGESSLLPDVYAGWLFAIGDEDYMTLLRFQWQLAL